MNGEFYARPVALLFAGYDQDHDTIVTWPEAEAGIAVGWADAGGQARIAGIAFTEWSERNLGSKGALPGLFSFDRNRDGSVDAEEFAQHLRDEFEALDRNKDEALSRSELVREMAIRTEGPGGGGRGRRQPPGDMPPRR
ncbi:hypothetical protein [Parvularcula dongshanensis]|uniref:EF-hand domain-containing protein n=1 Tax=Parvularcula dongshanensis TaxID=1173995 RepID=A0A840I832_9PROT|nr:hypothetical protein [Parvularcula dongshanensis]MBB4660413.1 hypothetical protein [Parvularcula dongshanensis]